MTEATGLSVYLCIVAGIFELANAVVKQLATPPHPGAVGILPFLHRVWPVARPYVFMAIFSFLSVTCSPFLVQS
jgi:hypothetical protein